MKTYKNIEHLQIEAEKNNGQEVFIWDDDGIKVKGKKYYMFEYGDMDSKVKSNNYVTFRNEGHKGKGNRNNPIGTKDTFITIEYELLSTPDKPTSCNIFKFKLIRECW